MKCSVISMRYGWDGSRLVSFITDDKGTYFSCKLHPMKPAVNESRVGDEGTNLGELEHSHTDDKDRDLTKP